VKVAGQSSAKAAAPWPELRRRAGSRAYGPWLGSVKALGERGDEGELTTAVFADQEGAQVARSSVGRLGYGSDLRRGRRTALRARLGTEEWRIR